jgi:hypothetical protein
MIYDRHILIDRRSHTIRPNVKGVEQRRAEYVRAADHGELPANVMTLSSKIHAIRS